MNEQEKVEHRNTVALLTAINGAKKDGSDYEERVEAVFDLDRDDLDDLIGDLVGMALTLSEWHLGLVNMLHERAGGPSPAQYLQHLGTHGCGGGFHPTTEHP
jgi:hypothetical protein